MTSKLTKTALIAISLIGLSTAAVAVTNTCTFKMHVDQKLANLGEGNSVTFQIQQVPTTPGGGGSTYTIDNVRAGQTGSIDYVPCDGQYNITASVADLQQSRTSVSNQWKLDQQPIQAPDGYAANFPENFNHLSSSN